MNMQKTYILEGLDCPNCAAKKREEAAGLAGVRAADLNLMRQTLVLELERDLEGLFEQVSAIVRSHEPDVLVREALAGCRFLLKGLDCPNCAAKIEQEAKTLEGVADAEVNLAGQTLLLQCAAPVSADDVAALVHRFEPEVEVALLEDADAGQDAHETAEDRGDKRRLLRLCAASALYAAVLILHYSGAMPAWAGLAAFLAIYLLSGWDVLWRALRNIGRGQVFDENFLMSISTLGAFAIGEYPEAAAVMIFYQIGEYFQDRAVSRSRKSISTLMGLRPDFARVLRQGRQEQVSPSGIVVGETILVRPGERVPLDGTVVSGQGMLDMQALTGESLPRPIACGEEILSGSICLNSALEIRVSRPYGESTVARIISLVENAAGRKAPTEHFITAFARRYTPAVVFMALALALLPPLFTGQGWAEWFRRACVFLVISCPCALVISIPLAFFGGIGAAARQGVLVKGGNYLEALCKAGTVVFDKTGTLTRGSFDVSAAYPAPGIQREELIRKAALAESLSNHPIARSIAALAPDAQAMQAERCEEIFGRGVRVIAGGRELLAGSSALMEENGIAHPAVSDAGTKIYVAENGACLGCLVVSDTIKPTAKSAVERLKELGVRRIIMLTGDAPEIAASTAAGLGIGEWHAGLLPSQKVDILEQLDKDSIPSKKLCFVGDGINDAPALARADVGVAMGALGSEAAIEAADVVIMSDDPARLADAVSVARRTRAIAMQNIAFALGVKSVLLILGALGMATMWEAVFGDVGVMMLAVLNSLRMLKIKEEVHP